MKFSLNIILLLIILSGCNNEPTACFTIDSDSMDDDGYPKLGERISFKNCSENADSYTWDFDDGSSSSEMNPFHEFDEAGFYIVTCEAENKRNVSVSTAYLNIVSLEGSWIGYIELNGSTLPIEIDMEQDDVDDFDGEFQFSDGSGSADLSKTGIDEYDIEFDVNISYAEGSSVEIEFEGEINPQYDNMSGECDFSNDAGNATGTWALYRDASKSKAVTMKGTVSELTDSMKTLLN